MENEEVVDLSFEDSVREFSTHAFGLRRTAPLFFELGTQLHRTSKAVRERFVEEHSTNGDIQPGFYNEFVDIHNAYNDTGATMVTLPRMVFVTFVGLYDQLISQCVRLVCDTHPDIVKSSGKQFSIADLETHGSIESVKRHCLEDLVEGVMRKSHVEQLEWLAEKMDTRLRPNRDSLWKSFVECMQRRHLFVHTGGVVSESYIVRCKDHDVDLPDDLKVGKTLRVDRPYFGSSFSTIFVVGTLVSQVAWRRLRPVELEMADRALNESAFSAIQYGLFDVAIDLLQFAEECIREYSSESARLMMRINLAQAFKWAGKEKECKEVLADIDQAAIPLKFAACWHALNGSFNDAAKLAEKAISINELSEEDLEEWPAFREFRCDSAFAELFKRLTGQEWATPASNSVRSPLFKMLEKAGVGVGAAGPDGVDNKGIDTDPADGS